MRLRAKRGTLRVPPPVRKGSATAVRLHARKADSRKRSPSGAQQPETSGRAASVKALQIPLHVRAAKGDLRPVEREYIRRKLLIKLGKYARSIERISVRLEDVNGPRGGVDQSCRIKVVLRALPSVVFESRDAALKAAVDAALAGVERVVRRTVQRRRMKPLRTSS